METNVRVAVRSRPMSNKEVNRMCTSIVSMPDNKRVKIKGGMLCMFDCCCDFMECEVY